MDNRTLINYIASATETSEEDVGNIISDFCKVLGERCVDMDSVIIPGFGQFEARKRKERIMIHPASGQRMMVPPKLVLSFKPSGILKSKIND